MSIAENIKKIHQEINDAAIDAGRDASDIILLAVTKTRTVDEILEAAEAGVFHFGENRVQEASDKIPEMNKNVVWHMIGPLQTNKSKLAVTLFEWIDSIHSQKIADVLSSRAVAAGRTLKVLIQVNISGEQAKSGVTPADVKKLAKYVVEKDGLELNGLMTIGSFGVTHDVTRSEYASMRELFNTLRDDNVLQAYMNVLSMGMSDDYRIAVEEGSTMVRIGTSIFGARK
ncbi:MAG: YggS family pyridoxal phosphate-dependent enzyme [Candidatus Latescibacteria bacterium]|nr:YggS family pyridoxal phosphate-dependent enzyme [Candidatus Latescibacterota bacterium]